MKGGLCDFVSRLFLFFSRQNEMYFVVMTHALFPRKAPSGESGFMVLRQFVEVQYVESRNVEIKIVNIKMHVHISCYCSLTQPT
jgi:hypothetical protein